MPIKKKTYHKKMVSPEVLLLWEAWHNLRGPFTGWTKTTNSNSVRFESTYRLVKKKRVVVEYIEEIKIAVTMPPLTNDPKSEFKIALLGMRMDGEVRKKVKKIIWSIVRKFIVRNY